MNLASLSKPWSDTCLEYFLVRPYCTLLAFLIGKCTISSMRTFFIGDVHGCFDELIELTHRIGLRDDDRLFFAGDIINKWPKSLEVVEWIRARPNTYSVLGNHEYFSLESKYTDHGQWNLSWIDIQYKKSEKLRDILTKQWHKDWLLSLPVIIEEDNFILVHGWIHPDYGINTPLEIATLIRFHDERPWYEYYSGTKPIIYGHWALDGLRIRSNTIGLDSGCCFGGHLTAYCLETKNFYQVRAHAVYKNPAHWKL